MRLTPDEILGSTQDTDKFDAESSNSPLKNLPIAGIGGYATRNLQSSDHSSKLLSLYCKQFSRPSLPLMSGIVEVD